jgi:hypothetical protein
VAGAPVPIDDPIRRALFARHSFEEILKKMVMPKPVPLVVQGYFCSTLYWCKKLRSH